MSTTIDLNADLGETTAGNPVADDASMLTMVSSANVATGFHAGDPHSIAATLAEAKSRAVTIGAHIAYHDPAGFGRRFVDYDPAELADETLYQIGALDALASAQGLTVRYVKPHGALYNTIAHHAEHARAVVDGVKAFSRDLALMLLPGGVAVDIAEAAGLRVIREAFADRGYNPDGTLVSRRAPGAVITDPGAVAERVAQVAATGSVTAIDGSTLEVRAESVCVHGDSPGAVELTRSVVERLGREGIEIRSAL
ncbi:LamB/YcsF family protein [Corynebacterium liangguodongii]|uniref:LamB/YcsF family protein n=1 Tax=Corynebacterium liangguodongii TaxID=2079535 RepID=A0A2S0WD71_9CORY|nr:5-oxoprolinase subunit PxpA [Corynebacterium liangguodongii]AWB83694.1 LamB/YcsF family protein [Corynebacterium liangguodongii]PWB99496.1 LamB/YcsF family protein [Corynebacterium liangguodongii]